jgi:SAM-dependent methyltransferase
VAASPFAALFDKRARALTAARFKAWWDGKAFNAEAFAADAPANDRGADDVLFDPTPDHRQQALQLVWGDARLAPGDETVEELAAARLALVEGGMLAVSGIGLAGPLKAMAAGHQGEFVVLEWRAETRAALAAGIKAAGLDARCTLTPFDLETGHLGDESFDALLSVDDFTYCENPARLALQFARGLKAGCSGLIEAYAGAPGNDLAPAFASAFAQPQVQPAAKIGELLFEAGLRIEEEEDLTELHIEWARAGFQRLKTNLDGATLAPRGLQELAWEMQTWRERLRLLSSRRMERRGWRVTRR